MHLAAFGASAADGGQADALTDGDGAAAGDDGGAASSKAKRRRFGGEEAAAKGDVQLDTLAENSAIRARDRWWCDRS